MRKKGANFSSNLKRYHLGLIWTCLGGLLVIALVRPMAGWAVTDAIAPLNIGGRGEGYRPEEERRPRTFGPIITGSGTTLAPGRFSFQPSFALGFTRVRFSQNWRRISAGGDYQILTNGYSFSYGLFNNLAVNAKFSYIHKWADDVNKPGPQGERSGDYGGMGDTRLNLKYQLVKETQTLPAVSARFGTLFPTGHFCNLNPALLRTDHVGRGSYVFTPGLSLSKWVTPFRLYGDFRYSMQTAKTDDNGRKYPRDFVTANVAAEYPLIGKWVSCLEMVSRYEGGRMVGHKSNELPRALISLAPELQYMATNNFSLASGVKFDVAGKKAFGRITPMMNLAFSF